MIRNRNLVFGSANDSSHDDDKFIQLPKISSSSLPTATADGNQGENEGGLAYDTTNNEWRFSDGSAWEVFPRHIEVTYGPIANGDIADVAVFIANEKYEVTAIREIHTTAESGGTVGIDIERLQDTETPGGNGDSLTSSAADGTGTADTVQSLTIVSDGTQQLSVGDRLGINFTGDSPGELDGVTITVQLKRY